MLCEAQSIQLRFACSLLSHEDETKNKELDGLCLPFNDKEEGLYLAL